MSHFPSQPVSVQANAVSLEHAGVILGSMPNCKLEKDRGKEPQRPKKDFPWFWNGSEFTGDRLNDIHLTQEQKEKARI